MNASQKALYLQLQLAGLGLIIAAFGIFKHVLALLGVGGFVFAYGLIRFFFFKKHLHAEDPSDLSEEEIRELMDPLDDQDHEEEDD